MHAFHGWKQAGTSAFLFVLVIVLWVLVAPLQLGGATSFVVITGKSMEPGFHTGDLVIVRKSGSYQVGDIVAYRAFEGRALVFHRIIGQEGERYVFKGDNNSWVDSFKPVHTELVGKLWVHIPRLGQAIRWLRNPLPFSILAGLFGFALLAVAFQEPDDPKRKRSPRWAWLRSLRPSAWLLPRPGKEFMVKTTQPKSTMRKERPSGTGSIRSWASLLDTAVFVLGFLALAALLLGLFAFTRPLWRETTGTLSYQQTGSYAYTAEVPEGIYDTTSLDSGQPVFVKLTCAIELRFDYALSGGQLEDLTGSHQLTARITETRTGWTRTFDLEPRTHFSGDAFSTDAVIDLCQLEEMARAVEEQTGTQPSYYTLVVEPQVQIDGRIGGQELQEQFNPSLVFQLDQIVFYMVRSNDDTDPLHPVQEGQLSTRQMEPNTLVFFTKAFEVGSLRRLAAVSFGVSAVLLVLVISFATWIGRRSPTDSLHLKYASVLVDVESVRLQPDMPVFAVKSMEDLARLADREHTLILHLQEADGHQYLVQTERAMYRYQWHVAEFPSAKQPQKETAAAGKTNRSSKGRTNRTRAGKGKADEK